MCLGPEAALALALAGAGQGVNAFEANRSAKAQSQAQEGALLQELDRQDDFQRDSGTAFQDAIQSFSKNNQDQNVGDLLLKNTEALQRNQSAPADADFAAVTGNAPKVVKSSLAKSLSDAVGEGQANAGRLAKLRGVGDQIFGNNLRLNTTGNKIRTVGNFARNSANVNRAEQQEAFNNAKKGPSGIGDLLSLAGSGLSLGAAGGATFGDVGSGANSLFGGTGFGTGFDLSQALRNTPSIF